jgi:dTDP-glucose pyrophosphorylase
MFRSSQIRRGVFMLNIVIPMAGLGSRFARAGYRVPKPLIPVHGVPMIRLVIDNIRPRAPHRFIFVCQRAHDVEYDLRAKLQEWAPGCAVVPLDGLTEGAACTVLAARSLIDSEQPLMLANSDQYVDVAIDPYLESLATRRLDGLVMTMQASDPKWSYAAVNQAGLVTEVAEKRPISRNATVGIYNFARGSDFIWAAEAMIASGERVGGEFYVAPVYNRLVAAHARIGLYDIGSEGSGMHGLGIPEDLDIFLATELSRRMVVPAL